MAGFKPFSKAKAIREASTSKPCLGTCAARTSLQQEIPSWLREQVQRNRESHAVIPIPTGLHQHSCPGGLTRLLSRGAHGHCSTLNTQYPPFRDAAAAAASGHPLLSQHGRPCPPPFMDRFMGALCEPTRCRPSTAPTWLLNQQHPDKTWGDTLSWERRARQGCTGDSSHPPSPTRAGMQEDPQGCQGVLVPPALCAKRGRATPLPLGIEQR